MRGPVLGRIVPADTKREVELPVFRARARAIFGDRILLELTY